MASSVYTVSSVWREAVRDFSDDVNVLHFEKVIIVNRAVEQVVKALYPLIADYYQKTANYTLSAVSGDYIHNKVVLPTNIHTQSIEDGLLITSLDYPLTPIKRMDFDEFKSWRPSAVYNRLQIVCASDNKKNLYFMQGSAIVSIGSVSVVYPGLPVSAVAETDYLDIPDSLDIELVILKVRSILATRNHAPVPDVDRMLSNAVRMEYEKVGIKLSKETTEKKLEQLREA